MKEEPNVQKENTAGKIMDEVITIEKKKEKKGPFIVGFIVLSLAIVGIAAIVSSVVSYVEKNNDTTADYTKYSDFLTWVVGVDPNSFSDITKADKDSLRNIAICTLLSDDTITGKYNVTEKGLEVPIADVELYYYNMFGADNPIVHANVVGYGYSFTYDAARQLYYVPLTGVTPPFSARIESVEKTGGLVVLRVGYVGVNKVEVAPDGTLQAAQPDKYADITLKETQTGFNLISVMTVTMGEYEQ